MICHVMYNYAAKDKDELSLRAGEVLHLLNTEYVDLCRQIFLVAELLACL